MPANGRWDLIRRLKDKQGLLIKQNLTSNCCVATATVVARMLRYAFIACLFSFLFVCLITDRHATGDIHAFACHSSALAINKLRSSLGGILCFLSFCMSDKC